MICNLSQYINLLGLAVVLAAMAKLAIILKLELKNILRRVTSLICFNSYNTLFLKIDDKANSKSDLKIKETLHINWRKFKCTAKSLSSHTFHKACVSPLFLSVFVFTAFLFHLLFSLSLALMISIFYFLNCTSLLLHFIAKHLVSHLTLSSIILIISDNNYRYLLLSFHGLNYTLLLLHLIITHLVNTVYNNYVINICPRLLL